MRTGATGENIRYPSRSRVRNGQHELYMQLYGRRYRETRNALCRMLTAMFFLPHSCRARTQFWVGRYIPQERGNETRLRTQILRLRMCLTNYSTYRRACFSHTYVLCG